MVMLMSPQMLTNTHTTFIESIKERITFVIADEIHMFNDFGRSYREEFQKLKSVLFSVLDNNVPLLLMTATSNNRIKQPFKKIISVNITSINRPTLVEFFQRFA